MTIENLFFIAAPLTYSAMYMVERLRPARKFPKVKGWGLAGAGFMVLMMSASVVTPLLLPVEWLAAHRWIDGTRLGIVGGTIVGYLAVSLAAFLWHRAEHGVPILWRAFHQLHHSPTRLDIPGSVYFHPLDVAAHEGRCRIGLAPLHGVDDRPLLRGGLRDRAGELRAHKWDPGHGAPDEREQLL